MKKRKITKCSTPGCDNSVELEYAIFGGEKICISCVKKKGYM